MGITDAGRMRTEAGSAGFKTQFRIHVEGLSKTTKLLPEQQGSPGKLPSNVSVARSAAPTIYYLGFEVTRAVVRKRYIFWDYKVV
jgi:hypothetical protein